MKIYNVFNCIKIEFNFGAPDGGGSSTRQFSEGNLEIYFGERNNQKHITFYYQFNDFISFVVEAGQNVYDITKGISTTKNPNYFSYFIELIKENTGYSVAQWVALIEESYNCGFRDGEKNKIKEIKKVLDINLEY